MELESRRSEVLNLSWEEREVGVSHAKDLKKKKKKKKRDLGLRFFKERFGTSFLLLFG